jgi:DNA-directed RNA polymerase specialized sigma24 family protein
MKESEYQQRIDDKMTAIVALLAALLEAQQVEGGRKIEVILADSGLPAATIAKMLGKKADTVFKAITRAKKKDA